MGRFFALAERLVNRGASALITLLVAAAVGPTQAGAYAFATLVLTLIQAIGEAAIRQVGTVAWQHSNGPEFLKRASFLSATVGTAGMLAGLALGIALGVATPSAALQLSPLLIVPLINGAAVGRLTLAQVNGQWREISRAQTIASAASLALAVPLVGPFGLLAAALQSVVAEGGTFALLPRRTPYADRLPETPLFRKYLLPTAESNAYGWMQGQADRLVASVAGQARILGLYSLAVSLTRTGTDAVTSGLVNHFRAQLALTIDSSRLSLVLQRGLYVGGLSGGVLTLLTLGASSLLPILLGGDWTPAVRIVPILALAITPLSGVAYLSAFLVHNGDARRLRPLQYIGLALSLTAGFVVTRDIFIGATVAAFRDVVAWVLRMIVLRKSLTPRAALVSIASCVLSWTACGLFILITQR